MNSLRPPPPPPANAGYAPMGKKWYVPETAWCKKQATDCNRAYI